MQPTSTPSQEQDRPVQRGRRRGWLIALATLLLLGGGALAWLLRPQRQSFYTDAEHIREPVESAHPRDVLWQPPVRLPEPLNSTGDDYEPRLSPDGMSLFFVRGKAGENADIYVCQRVSTFSRDPDVHRESAASDALKGWTQPEPLSEINSEADDLGPEPSPDGHALYFYSNRAGGLGGYDLWVAHRGETGWLEPVNLGPQVNSPFNDYGPALSPDGATLYFASNRPRPHEAPVETQDAWPATIREDLFKRDYDLYAATIADHGFGSAVPLDSLNTPHNEGSPAVSPVGDFLYFASDRPGGRGGFDLYRARRLRGELLPPENLGGGVNTEANELDPAPGLGGFALHFSSDRPWRALPPGARPDYELYRTSSREVFTETQTVQASIDWAGLWSTLWPSLLLALLTLLLLLLLLRYLGGLRSRELSLLARCLLASMFLHLLLLFLLSFWNVTASIAGALERRGGIRVALVSPASANEITGQILSSLTEVPLESAASESARATMPPAQREMEQPMARVDPKLRRVEAETTTLVREHTDDAATRLPELATSPEVQLDRDSSAITDVALPAPAAAAQAAEAKVKLQTAAANGPAADESVLRAAIKASQSAEPVIIAAVPASVLPAPAIPLTTQASDVREAAPADRAELASSPEKLALASNSQIAVALPPAAEDRVASASEPTSAPQAAALPPSPAPPAPSAHRELSESDFARLEPSPSPPDFEPAASMARLEESQSDAAPSSAAASPLPAEPVPPAALNLNELAVPPAEIAEKAAPGQPNDTRFAPMPVPSAQAATGPLHPDLTAITLEQVALDPAQPGARASAETSLVPSLRSPSDASPSPTTPTMPPTTAGEAQTDELALSVRLPTELLPPENPYAQREVPDKQELVNRLGGSEETERAVTAALDWLAAHQSADGRWDGDGFDRGCGRCGGETDLEVDVGLTGLALLCFLGANHTHAADGPYRQNVERGVSWLLELQQSDGDLRGAETMYSHGIAAIALSEAHGMTRDPRLAEPVRLAMRFIEGARNQRAGGWRYDPGQAGDTSVLGWQVMALKSAQMAGVPVAPETFDAAGRWLDKVSTAGRPGLYAYQPQRRPSHAMTAEGMFVQQLLGVPHDEGRMIASADYLASRLPDWNRSLDTYYWYYATLALFQHQGDHWRRWNQALTRELLANQVSSGRAAGSWPPRGKWADKGGRVYQTALCTLMLEVYYRYLPLYTLPGQPRQDAASGGASSP